MLCNGQDAPLHAGKSKYQIMSQSKSLLTQDVLIKPCYVLYASLQKRYSPTEMSDQRRSNIHQTMLKNALGMRAYMLLYIILRYLVEGVHLGIQISTVLLPSEQKNSPSHLPGKARWLDCWVRLTHRSNENANEKLEVVISDRDSQHFVTQSPFLTTLSN